MSDERKRLMRGCERWKNSLAYYLTLKPTKSNVESICHSSSYLISWLNDLHDCDERLYEQFLFSSKYFLNKASEVIFDHFYANCRRNTPNFSLISKRYVKSVGKLIDHVYYVLWCSYFSGREDFLDHIFNIFLCDIVVNLPPTSKLKGRAEKDVGRDLWELLTYFEKLLDYDVPGWAIQKFQTDDLLRPKIYEEDTYNIMTTLDNLEQSFPSISDDFQYRAYRSELLRSTERGAHERRKALKNALGQRCRCGASVKLVRSDITLNRIKDNIVLLTKTECKICGRIYNFESSAQKTKEEFDALEQLDEYLDSNYNISLIQKIKDKPLK
jgi:hypothetical protein